MCVLHKEMLSKQRFNGRNIRRNLPTAGARNPPKPNDRRATHYLNRRPQTLRAWACWKMAHFAQCESVAARGCCCNPCAAEWGA